MTRDAVPYPQAVPATEAIALPALEGDDTPVPPQEAAQGPARQCGRCRMLFDADPTLDLRARREWWLCPACEAVLLPGRAKKSNVLAFPPPVQARDEG